MRYLAYFILFFGMLYSSQIKAVSTIHTNLSYFFQGENVELSKIQQFEIEIEAFVKYLRQFDQEPPKKRIDKVVKEIAKKYFKQYNNEGSLLELMVVGQHNALSATALNALIFTELKIPFKIEEKEDGLALIAFPEKEKIICDYVGKQTIFHWVEQSQVLVSSFLIDMGATTVSQLNMYGTILTIDMHFNVNRTISLKELAGLGLLKKAIQKIELQEFEKSATYIALGKQFYPNVRFGYLSYGVLTILVEKLAYDNILIMDYLLQLYDLTRQQGILDRLKHNISHVYNVALNERRDFEFTDSSKALVEVNLTRQDDKNLILSEMYKLEMGYYALRKDIVKAFESADKSLELNPKNKVMQDVFAELIVLKLTGSIEYGYTETQEVEIMRDSLNYYIQLHPFLKESPSIKRISIMMKCVEVSNAFDDNDAELGTPLLAELETLIKEYDIETSDIKPKIANAFSEVAVYYYRQKNYTLALEWIDKALSYNPTAEFIKVRKRNIENQL